MDLVVGNLYGSQLTYMENTGTSTAPVFAQRTGSANPFDGIEVGISSTPALGDFDNDGTTLPPTYYRRANVSRALRATSATSANLGIMDRRAASVPRRVLGNQRVKAL